MIKLLSSRLAWAILLVIAIVLLVIGSINPPASSTAARISRLDSLIKCPGCEDLSIAESEAPSSVTLRNEVAVWVHDGWSNERIEQAVVARYGQSGLLLPSAAGVDAALYFIPLGAIAVAAGVLGSYFWRRQRRLVTAATGVPR
ncbi:MAG TPA: cytochrome c-type biogenesis protein CcmH [Acidimicrobiales bacterium]|nr:cytochrome c-type biogenesis protein CcmH [Acidimicrobiales bacterium]